MRNQPRSRASMPRGIWPRKQIPYNLIQLDHGRPANTRQETPSSRSTPLRKVPLLVGQAAPLGTIGAAFVHKRAPCLLYLADRYGHEFRARRAPARRSGDVCDSNVVLFGSIATLATALFVEARARGKEFPRLMGRPQHPGWRAEPRLLVEALGVADLRCTGPNFGLLRIFSPSSESRRLPTRAGQHRGHPGAVSPYQRRWRTANSLMASHHPFDMAGHRLELASAPRPLWDPAQRLLLPIADLASRQAETFQAHGIPLPSDGRIGAPSMPFWIMAYQLSAPGQVVVLGDLDPQPPLEPPASCARKLAPWPALLGWPAQPDSRQH